MPTASITALVRTRRKSWSRAKHNPRAFSKVVVARGLWCPICRRPYAEHRETDYTDRYGHPLTCWACERWWLISRLDVPCPPREWSKARKAAFWELSATYIVAKRVKIEAERLAAKWRQRA